MDFEHCRRSQPRRQRMYTERRDRYSMSLGSSSHRSFAVFEALPTNKKKAGRACGRGEQLLLQVRGSGVQLFKARRATTARRRTVGAAVAWLSSAVGVHRPPRACRACASWKRHRVGASASETQGATMPERHCPRAALRAASNSSPGVQPGMSSALATRTPTAKPRRASSIMPSKFQSGRIWSLGW